MSSAEVSPVKAGDILADKYKVDRVLGIGGMGVVVQAHHLQLEERVAIKFLLPDALNNEEAVERFGREARAAVKIKSEHVARVTDVGTLANKSPYMVMEFLEGEDLGQVLDRGNVQIDDAVDFVLQACEAIAEAHSLGIVHRDLKPANLFVTRRADGSTCVKVLDFGISKIVVAGDSQQNMSMTKTTAVMGSPLYMSPEQMRSARYTDARSDIWSIGVILYELLTGDVPFHGESVPELCMAVLTEEPPLASAKRHGVSPGLDQVIQKCLAREPVNRYQTVGELALALVDFAPKRSRLSAQRAASIGRGPSGAAVVLESIPPPTRKNPTMAAWGTTSPGHHKSRRRMAVLGGGAAALALGIAAFVLLRSPGPLVSALAGEPPTEAAPVVAPAPTPVFPAPVAPVVPEVKPETTVAPAVAPAVPTTTATPVATKVGKPRPATRPAPRPTATTQTKTAADVFDGRK